MFVNPFERGEIGPDLFRAACDMGLEGLVSKRRDRPYQAGRSKNWPKALIPPGAVLVSAAVGFAVVAPYFDGMVSPCFDNHATRMMCQTTPIDMADHPEREHAPLQAQRTLTVAAASTGSTHNLIAATLKTATPVLGAPAFAQIHRLTAAAIVSGS